jgi:hypothetical protein
MGFVEDAEDPSHDELQIMTVPVQSLYREWKVKESELEKIRPYFGENSLARSKISPLEIVRVGKPKADSEIRPSPGQSRPVLSLKKRIPTP